MFWRYFILGLVMVFAVALRVSGQTRLVRSMQIINTTTQTGQILEANSSSTQSKGLTFPGTLGTAGQIITVTGTTNGVSDYAWSTPAGSFSGLASVQAADINDGGGATAATAITLSANTSYRIIGEFQIYRGASNGSLDAFSVELRGLPANGTAEYTFECLNCPAGTTFNPPNAATTSAFTLGPANAQGNLAGPQVNPGGATVYCGPANTFTYRVEGSVTTGAATAAMTFYFNKVSGADVTTILAGSYFLVTPLK